jgi:hypothetical protein
MSPQEELQQAERWLERETARLAFGKVTVTTVVHQGQLSKVFRVIEESISSPAVANGDNHGNKEK